jgi:Ca-activated chloride channel homolog
MQCTSVTRFMYLLLFLSTMTGLTAEAGAQRNKKLVKASHAESTIKEKKASALNRNVASIRLPVIVTDKDGRAITNLKRENFTILEDKQPKKIADFQSAANFPLYVAMLLDTGATSRGKLKFEKEVTLSFLQTALRRDSDQALFVTFGSTVEMHQDFTDDLNLLIKAINPVKASGKTALYDAVYQVCAENMSKLLTPRRILVVFAGGNDEISNHTLAETIEMAQRSEVVIFGISIKGTGFFGIESGQVQNEDKELRRLCEETGGNIFYPSNTIDLERTLARIYSMSRRHYLISYQTEGLDRPGQRTIEVKLVGRDGLNTFARTGYRVGRPSEKPCRQTIREAWAGQAPCDSKENQTVKDEPVITERIFCPFHRIYHCFYLIPQAQAWARFFRPLRGLI